MAIMKTEKKSVTSRSNKRTKTRSPEWVKEATSSELYSITFLLFFFFFWSHLVLQLLQSVCEAVQVQGAQKGTHLKKLAERKETV